MKHWYASEERSESLSKVFSEKNNWFVYEIPSLNKIGICLEKNFPSRPAEQADDYQWIASVPSATKKEAMDVEFVLQVDRNRNIDGSRTKHSTQTTTKMSESHTGKIQSEEHNRAISKGTKNVPKSDSHRKSLSKAATGRIWINNGFENKHIKSEESVPDGWIRGRKTKEK